MYKFKEWLVPYIYRTSWSMLIQRPPHSNKLNYRLLSFCPKLILLAIPFFSFDFQDQDSITRISEVFSSLLNYSSTLHL